MEAVKTLVQCDFDGTITQEDASFRLLDTFADGDWRQLLAQYRNGEISVGAFNSRAFAMVKADRQTMVDAVRRTAKIRDGFHQLLDYCRGSGFRFVIVSNGLSFYIETILGDIGAGSIEVFAAETKFNPRGLEVEYIGPDDVQLQDGFKEAYARLFIRGGYRLIYIGNGLSDAQPAKLAYRAFATDQLLDCCRKLNLDCISFVDFNDVVKSLESLMVGEAE